MSSSPVIPPEDARALLEADLANVIKQVEAGTPLSARHRALLAKFAESQQQQPEAPAQPPLAPAPAADPLPAPAAPIAQPHSPFPARYTQAQLEAYGTTYGTHHRAIRRWINLGREHGDPVPLDSPAHMPGWWERRMKHRIPEKILTAARLAGPLPEPPPSASPAPEPAPAAVAAQASAPAPVTSDTPDLAEGEEVRIARQQVAAAAEELERARQKGGAGRDDYTYWSRQLREAMETYRKHKSEDREAAKARGLVISRAEVCADIANVLRMLSQLRANMSRVLQAELRAERPDITPETLTLIAAKVERLRQREETIFLDLTAIQSPDDVLRLVS